MSLLEKKYGMLLNKQGEESLVLIKAIKDMIGREDKEKRKRKESMCRKDHI